MVGDTEIRKGEGMQLDQLIQDASYSREASVRIRPFDLDVLTEAFQLRETAPIDLPAVIILLSQGFFFFYIFLFYFKWSPWMMDSALGCV